MKHTHSVITHPALRHRMANALNRIRHMYQCEIGPQFWGMGSGRINWVFGHRAGARLAVKEMALLEQALDEAQYARISETMWLTPETNLDLIQLERED